jgi:hypothetical protein
MRHLKKFEEVDYDQLRDQIHSGFYGSKSDGNNDGNDSSFDQACPDCKDDVATCDCVDYDDEEFGPGYVKPSNREEYDEEEDNKPWGDENIKLERFSTFNEKKKAPKKDKKKDDEKTPKRPDFKDFDGDGDQKEPMTKALKDKEEKDKGGKKFEKPKKGEIPAALAAYQKKKKK